MENSIPRIQKRYPEESREFWINHFSNMRDSDISNRAYCRQHGLNYERMNYWRKRLNETKPKKLLPITIKETPPLSDIKTLSSNFVAELHLQDGITLRISSYHAFSILIEKMIAHATLI